MYFIVAAIILVISLAFIFAYKKSYNANNKRKDLDEDVFGWMIAGAILGSMVWAVSLPILSLVGISYLLSKLVFKIIDRRVKKHFENK